MKGSRLTNMILIALALGIVSGVVINEFFTSSDFVMNVLVGGIFTVIGDLFLNAIKMLVVPLVFVSIALGVATMGDMAKLGRIGIKTISYYMLTTAFAIVIGLVVANIINPGVGLDMSKVVFVETTTETTVSLADTITNIIPSNVFQAFYNGDMLQVIFFAVFFGVGITSLGDKVKKLHIIFEELNDIFLQMLMILMQFAPVAVFSLIITTFATLGIEAIIPVFSYVFTAIFAMFLQVLIIYSLILVVLGKLNPLKFYKKLRPAMGFAFSTASSAGTIPVNKKCVEESVGVDKEISSFVLPLGATINMDGTAIMQGAAVVFIAQAVGVDLTASDYLTVILTATLASIGTAGVPGSGVIMLSMVITQVGLPIEAIGVIMGVDRIVDMFRTTVNITGDAICATVVARSENALDDEIFNQEIEI
ncbi:dicarboxylate/amino acid:cation symporter [Mollicutes bacterium LVI A0078]|nr:dicarboxylate/amino acid:cation symporter [Mollicutes bacterium LVI A0075]WOO90244.1 dicarboxylate/amino acid:cation symporter [Mollicutes bacterium LVI A0078]